MKKRQTLTASTIKAQFSIKNGHKVASVKLISTNQISIPLGLSLSKVIRVFPQMSKANLQTAKRIVYVQGEPNALYTTVGEITIILHGESMGQESSGQPNNGGKDHLRHNAKTLKVLSTHRLNR